VGSRQPQTGYSQAGSGTAAVEALADGETGVMFGLKGTRIERVPLEEVVSKEQPLDSDLYRMAEVLAELPE
jgi:6-phosphofructokinase 1